MQLTPWLKKYQNKSGIKKIEIAGMKFTVCQHAILRQVTINRFKNEDNKNFVRLPG